MHTDRKFPRLSGLLALTALALHGPAAAQVGDISGVYYPGWIPSDRVVPEIRAASVYDSITQLWTYSYTLANGATAEQDILNFGLRYNGGTASITSPPGWWDMASSPAVPVPGAFFSGDLPDSSAYLWGPSPAQIPPGQSLADFQIVSPYPPGYARTYVQGFAPVPAEITDPNIPEGAELGVPNDTTNSQRGWTLGPTRYTQVLTPGTTDVVNANGFLGFMSLRLIGSELLDPAPIALEFALNGETVYRETLRVLLNGVDVTAAFHPGPADGADFVGVFRVGSSPLLPGPNELITTVEGLLPGTTERATDTDVISFTVRAN